MPDIASDALRYNGAGYVYGGAPAHGIGDWDCSSFVNWVIGHDCGLAIPGYAAGQYTGQSHGPVVIDWATWGGAKTTSSPSRGDLVMWPGIGPSGHIGIYLGPDQMISALNSSMGTKVTPIQGFGITGIPTVYRTLGSSNTSGSGGSGTTLTSASGPATLASLFPGCLIGMATYHALQYSGSFRRKIRGYQFSDRKGTRKRYL